MIEPAGRATASSQRCSVPRHAVEFFDFLGYTFDVALAWRLLGARREPPMVGQLALDCAASLLGFLRVDPGQAMGADIRLEVPLLGVWLDSWLLVIDGWLRLYKAAHLEPQVTRLPLIVLTERERDIVLDDPTGRLVDPRMRFGRHPCGERLLCCSNRRTGTEWWRAGTGAGVRLRPWASRVLVDDCCPRCGTALSGTTHAPAYWTRREEAHTMA